MNIDENLAVNHQQMLHDLRLRVLDGDDIEAGEMLLIVEDIRRGRRSAAAIAGGKGAAAKAAAKRKSQEVKTPADLGSIMDAEI